MMKKCQYIAPISLRFSRKSVQTILPPVRHVRTVRLCNSFDGQIEDLEKEERQTKELADQRKVTKREADSKLNDLQNDLHSLKVTSMFPFIIVPNSKQIGSPK